MKVRCIFGNTCIKDVLDWNDECINCPVSEGGEWEQKR